MKTRLVVLTILLLTVTTYWLLYRSSVLADTPVRLRLEWPDTDFSKSTVNLDEIRPGGPPRDGIPALDRPVFTAAGTADTWLYDNEPVIVVSLGQEVRAYPLQIMIYHEIANDTLAGRHIAVTFCPLCNATVVFDRSVDDRILDFGTTGKLRKSDLVMYDRQTGSWWQQLSGAGIVGHYAGQKLTQIPAQIISYRDLKLAYPDAEILSRKTGFSRPYGENPYHGYDSVDDTPFFLDEKADGRLRPMDRVIFIRVGSALKLYPFSVLKDEPVVNDFVGSTPVVVFSKHGTVSALDQARINSSRLVRSATAWSPVVDGEVMHFVADGDIFRDTETGSGWNILGTAVSGPLAGTQLAETDSGVHFAFAWLAFNPDSSIYRHLPANTQ